MKTWLFTPPKWYNWNTVQYLRSLLDNFFFKIIYRQIGTSGSVCSKNMYPFSASWSVTVLWGVGGRFPSGIRRLDDQKVFAFGVISVHKFFVRPSPNFLQIYFNFGEERRGGGGVLFFKNSPVNKKYKKFFFVIFSDLWDLGNFFGPPFNRQKVWSNFWTNFENHRLPRNNPRFALIILETIAGEEYCTSISARLQNGRWTYTNIWMRFGLIWQNFTFMTFLCGTRICIKTRPDPYFFTFSEINGNNEISSCAHTLCHSMPFEIIQTEWFHCLIQPHALWNLIDWPFLHFQAFAHDRTPRKNTCDYVFNPNNHHTSSAYLGFSRGNGWLFIGLP